MAKMSQRHALTRAAQHFQAGRYADALSIYESILEERPNHVDALNDAGLACAHLNRYEDAREHYLRALNEQSDHENAFFNLLALLEETNDIDAVEDIFDQFGSNIPASAEKSAYRERVLGRHIDLGADRYPPICIGGCGSSGTTLLRRIIDAHSEIACGKEMSVFDRPRMYDMTLRDLRIIYLQGAYDELEEGVPFPIRTQHGSYCGLKPGNHGSYYHTRQEVIELLHAADCVADFWDLYFLAYAQKRGKKRWAEKTPNNIFAAKHFLKAFPNGRFVHMVRDGRDVCLSLMQRRGYSHRAASLRWTMCMEAGRQIAGHDRVYTLRYEDLVAAPEDTVVDLFSWLGMSYEASVLDFARQQKERTAHGYAEQPIFNSSAGRWSDEWDQLPATTAAALDLSLQRHLVDMGYAPEETHVVAAYPDPGFRC